MDFIWAFFNVMTIISRILMVAAQVAKLSLAGLAKEAPHSERIHARRYVETGSTSTSMVVMMETQLTEMGKKLEKIT